MNECSAKVAALPLGLGLACKQRPYVRQCCTRISLFEVETRKRKAGKRIAEGKEKGLKVKTAEDNVSEGENEEDNPMVLIKWEQEWWRKEGAIIIN